MKDSREDDLILSYSRLSLYKECAFRCKNSLRPDSPEATAADLGGVAHDSLAIYCRKGEPEAKANAIKQAPASGLNTSQTNDLVTMLEKVMMNPRYQFKQENIICVESDDGDHFEHGRQMFLVELPVRVNGRRVFIRGAFDLVLKVEDGIEVIDWKSGFAKANKFQQEIYALIAYLLYWKIAPIRVRFVYIRSGFSEYEDFESTDMLGILQYVAILVNAYGNEKDWLPRFNKNCGNCEFRTGCKEYLDAMSKLPDTPKIDPENWDAIQKWSAHIAAIKSVATKFADELDELEVTYLKNHGETKALDGRMAYIGERTNRYGIPWDVVKGNIGDTLGMDGIVEYLSTTVVEEFLTKKSIEGSITMQQAQALMKIMEAQKIATSKSDAIKYKGEKPKKKK